MSPQCDAISDSAPKAGVVDPQRPAAADASRPRHALRQDLALAGILAIGGLVGILTLCLLIAIEEPPLMASLGNPNIVRPLLGMFLPAAFWLLLSLRHPAGARIARLADGWLRRRGYIPAAERSQDAAKAVLTFARQSRRYGFRIVAGNPEASRQQDAANMARDLLGVADVQEQARFARALVNNTQGARDNEPPRES